MKKVITTLLLAALIFTACAKPDTENTAAYFDVEDFDDYLAALKICTDITGRGDLYTQNGEAVREQVDAAVKNRRDMRSRMFCF